MRVDDFVRHCRVQASDVVAELARTAAAGSSADQSGDTAPATDGDRDTTADPPGYAPSPDPMVPDPLVVEYLRQRDGSKLRRWRDVDTGMCMTLIALDPIRDAVFKTAFDAHLNALARRREHRWHDVATGRSRGVHAHDQRPESGPGRSRLASARPVRRGCRPG